MMMGSYTSRVVYTAGMSNVTLRIQFEGEIREEVAAIKGSTPRTVMVAALEYVDRMNVGLKQGHRHVLLSVRPFVGLGKDQTKFS